MADDDPLGDDVLGLSGQTAAESAGRADGPPDGVGWVGPLVQRVARLRTAGVYELLLFVYADGRRGLTVRNAKNPHRLERL